MTELHVLDFAELPYEIWCDLQEECGVEVEALRDIFFGVPPGVKNSIDVDFVADTDGNGHEFDYGDSQFFSQSSRTFGSGPSVCIHINQLWKYDAGDGDGYGHSVGYGNGNDE